MQPGPLMNDALLSLDNPSHEPIVQPSSGVHITLPNYYSPRKMGLLDPATSDGRVIFFLPWQGNTIAGTTKIHAKVSHDPVASEEDIHLAPRRSPPIRTVGYFTFFIGLRKR